MGFAPHLVGVPDFLGQIRRIAWDLRRIDIGFAWAISCRILCRILGTHFSASPAASDTSAEDQMRCNAAPPLIKPSTYLLVLLSGSAASPAIRRRAMRGVGLAFIERASLSDEQNVQR